ncbi:MAG: hypothetical protein Q9218_005136 [Villophora microphyllina]
MSPAMFAEYVCVFGISAPVPQLAEGEAIACFYNGMTILTNHGKNGRVFWFVLQKMDRKHFYPNIPRFDDIDAEKICARLYDSKVWRKVTFQQIWDAREVHSIVPLEENVFDHWHYGRVVCLGDSMHKMTPNIGQGANTAIESAAALTNHLEDLVKARKIQKPTDEQVQECLEAFAHSRIRRARSTVKSSGFLTRLQARDGIFNRLLGRYIIPYAGDFPADHGSSVIRAAPRLDFLPLPRRLGKHWGQEARPSFVALVWAEWLKDAALLVLRSCAYSGALIPAFPVLSYERIRAGESAIMQSQHRATASVLTENDRAPSSYVPARWEPDGGSEGGSEGKPDRSPMGDEVCYRGRFLAISEAVGIGRYKNPSPGPPERKTKAGTTL